MKLTITLEETEVDSYAQMMKAALAGDLDSVLQLAHGRNDDKSDMEKAIDVVDDIKDFINKMGHNFEITNMEVD